MTRYLQHFPKPVLDDLVSGRWLPVIGAGMSLNARVSGPPKIPLWADLGAALAAELTDFAATGTLDAISAYQHEFGRARLIERLTDLLRVNRFALQIHQVELNGLPFGTPPRWCHCWPSSNQDQISESGGFVDQPQTHYPPLPQIPRWENSIDWRLAQVHCPRHGGAGLSLGRAATTQHQHHESNVAPRPQSPVKPVRPTKSPSKWRSRTSKHSHKKIR